MSDWKGQDVAFDPTVSPASGTPVTLTGADCRMHNVSDEYCTLLGRSRDDLLKATWPSIVHPDDLADPSAKQAILLARGEPYDVRCRIRRGDGSWLPLRFRASLVERWCGVPLIQSNACLDLAAENASPAEETGKAAAAEYIRTISGELAKLADRQGLKMLQHLLTMTSFEAAHELQKQFPGLTADIAGTLN